MRRKWLTVRPDEELAVYLFCWLFALIIAGLLQSLVLAYGVIISFQIAVAAWVVYRWSLARNANNWVRTTLTSVVNVHAGVPEPNGKTLLHIPIEYEYQYHGDAHYSRRISYPFFHASLDEIVVVEDALNSGEITEAYVHPGNPKLVVLVPKPIRSDYWLTFAYCLGAPVVMAVTILAYITSEYH